MLRKRKELILAVVFTVCLLIIIVQSSVLNSFFASKALSRNKKKQEKVVLGRKQLIPEPKEVIRKPSSGVPALEKPVEVTTTSQLETISRLKKKSFKRYRQLGFGLNF